MRQRPPVKQPSKSAQNAKGTKRLPEDWIGDYTPDPRRTARVRAMAFGKPKKK